MHQRSEERVPTGMVIIQVTGMRDLRDLHTTGLILDASPHGLRIVIKESVPAGSMLRLEVEGLKLVGQVRHCRPRGGGFALGIEILVGSVELERLLEQDKVLPAKS